MPKIQYIGPLEGNPMIRFLGIVTGLLILVAWLVSGFLSGLLWIIAFVFGLFLFSTLFYRLRYKWGHLHYPMMVRYAKAAGLTVGAKERGENLGSTIDFATTIMVKSVFSNISDEDLKEVLDQIKGLKRKLYSKEYLTKLFKKYPGLEDEKATQAATELSEILEKRKENLSPNVAIAYLVGEKYDEDEQMKYFHAVITNKAT